MLGVTFVTGTLVLGDTLNRTFDDLIGTAYQHVSFEIRGKAAFSDSSCRRRQQHRRPQADPAVDRVAVRRLPGVAVRVRIGRAGYAQFMTRDGNAIGDGGGSTLGFSFDPNRRLSPYRLVQGSAPTAADDVVMDKATATKYQFAVGDRVLMNLPDRPQTFTITGIVTFGSDDNLAGVTLAGFDPADRADRCSTPAGATTRSASWPRRAPTPSSCSGRSPQILPAGVQVVSGQAVANELSTAVDNELSFISTALLIFALISLFVGGVHDLQHVLDHRRAADPRAGAAARRRSEPAAGIRLGAGRGRAHRD